MLPIFMSLAYFFHLVSGLDASLQYFFFPHFLFGCTGSSLWHAGSSCLSRDQTLAPCIENSESLATGPLGKSHSLQYLYPLDSALL